MDGLARTNLVLAKILNIAMANGVCHWQLSFDELELGEEYEIHFFPCVEWLENEGLITVGEYARTLGGYASCSVIDIALTSRGMSALGQKIEIGGQQTTLAKQVEGQANGSISASAIGDFIGSMLGGYTKSIGS